MRLASRFGRYNSIRRERPLTDDELMQFVPSVFSGDKHESRSERYTYIPTINIINKLRDEGFQPFFACQSRVRDLGRREYSKHMLRLRREGHINGQEVPEIILLNSHDGSSSYQMIPGIFRFVCTNGRCAEIILAKSAFHIKVILSGRLSRERMKCSVSLIRSLIIWRR